MLEDIQVWKSQLNARLYSRSDTDRITGMARNEWVAIALRALLTDRVSKYVKNAVSLYAIKDWQWIARLVERLAHRGLIWYGIDALALSLLWIVEMIWHVSFTTSPCMIIWIVIVILYMILSCRVGGDLLPRTSHAVLSR